VAVGRVLSVGDRSGAHIEGGVGGYRLGSDFLVGKQVRQLVRGVRSAVLGPTGFKR
jgi:hypothetical protein